MWSYATNKLYYFWPKPKLIKQKKIHLIPREETVDRILSNLLINIFNNLNDTDFISLLWENQKEFPDALQFGFFVLLELLRK